MTTQNSSLATAAINTLNALIADAVAARAAVAALEVALAIDVTAAQAARAATTTALTYSQSLGAAALAGLTAVLAQLP